MAPKKPPRPFVCDGVNCTVNEKSGIVNVGSHPGWPADAKLMVKVKPAADDEACRAKVRENPGFAALRARAAGVKLHDGRSFEEWERDGNTWHIYCGFCGNDDGSFSYASCPGFVRCPGFTREGFESEGGCCFEHCCDVACTRKGKDPKCRPHADYDAFADAAAGIGCQCSCCVRAGQDCNPWNNPEEYLDRLFEDSLNHWFLACEHPECKHESRGCWGRRDAYAESRWTWQPDACGILRPPVSEISESRLMQMGHLHGNPAYAWAWR